MAKKGKALEQLVAKIQEILKDREDTSIESNVRLRDRDNVLREFDVLVRTTNQGLPSIIAFECKDFSTSKSKPSVDVKVVDGFNTKCIEFPEIKHKIIVSATGFSENAKIKAKSFGIGLIALENVSLDNIINKDVTLLKSQSRLGDIWYYQFDDQLYESRDILRVRDCNTDKEIDLLTFVKVGIHKTNLFQKLVGEFINNGRMPLKRDIKIDINNRFYIEDNIGKKHTLQNIIVPITINFDSYGGQVEKANKITQGTLDVGTVTYGFDNKDIKVHSIATDSKHECFIQVDGKYINPQFKIEVWDKGWK